MTCGETRQYIFAFFDNELDSALSLDVQQHLEHCPLCARECEVENVVRRELTAKLQQVDAVPEFDESALRRLIRSETRRPTHAPRAARRYWKIGTAGVVAATLLLAVSLYLAQSGWQPRGVSLADALVDDFDHFVSESKPLHIVSSDAAAVSEWLQQRTALAVSVPVVDPAIGSLVGGRKCKINGRPAAFAVFRVGNALASVVVLRESEAALGHMKRVDQNGHTHWIDHCRGHTVLACRRGDLIYAVISRLAEGSLSSLMPPAEG